MGQAYSNPSRENDPHALPNIEVFEITCGQAARELGKGFFWQACFPGCLPDGEAFGPFATYAEALADAQPGMED